jgi:lipopolysaccharide transport system permease protein
MESAPKTIIKPHQGLLQFNLRELWSYRELLIFLTWREVSVRYKQSIIGIGWAIIQPVVSMIIFTVIFGGLADMPSDDVPYAIFSFAALLPWRYFASAFGSGSQSLVGQANLITKVYFPRLIVPLTSILTPLVDFAIAFVILLLMMPFFGILPTLRIVMIIPFMLMAILTSLSVSLWLSALNVRYRDIGHAVPFLVQIWMYMSPVIYSASLVPDAVRPFYALNPMTGVIEGFRWALLDTPAPDITMLGISLAITLLLLFSGLIYFNRTERTFADVI